MSYACAKGRSYNLRTSEPDLMMLPKSRRAAFTLFLLVVSSGGVAYGWDPPCPTEVGRREGLADDMTADVRARLERELAAAQQQGRASLDRQAFAEAEAAFRHVQDVASRLKDWRSESQAALLVAELSVRRGALIEARVALERAYDSSLSPAERVRAASVVATIEHDLVRLDVVNRLPPGVHAHVAGHDVDSWDLRRPIETDPGRVPIIVSRLVSGDTNTGQWKHATHWLHVNRGDRRVVILDATLAP